mgnify:CR=1 FL=1
MLCGVLHLLGPCCADGVLSDVCSLFTVCVVQGNRATVPARCGQTLLDAAVMHKVDIEHPCEGKSSLV